MQMFLNLCNYCVKLFKSANFFLNEIYNDGLAHAHMVHYILLEVFHRYYENFLLVILCKYNLGLIRFAIAKWFFCGVLFLCSIEVAAGYLHICPVFFNLCCDFWSNGYVDVVDTFRSLSKDFWSIEKSIPMFPQPLLPKDLHVLTYETIDSINNIETVESIESMNNIEKVRSNPLLTRPYSIYVCAFALLYLGICVANSGA